MISGSKPSSPKRVRFDDSKKEPQDTHRDLAAAQMEGGFSSSGSGYSYNASPGSSQPSNAPEPLNRAPPQTVRVLRFPKEGVIERTFEKRQIVDVKADEHHGDAKLNHIPDFREDWGDGDSWQLHRKAFHVHVDSSDIADVKFHGTYVVFATYHPSYDASTHKMFKGKGRHVREDFFIAKLRKYRDANGWTVYDDMIDEYSSKKIEDGLRLWEYRLKILGGSSMVGLLGNW